MNKKDKLRILSDALLLAAAVFVALWAFSGGTIASRALAAAAILGTAALLFRDIRAARRK